MSDMAEHLPQSERTAGEIRHLRISGDSSPPSEIEYLGRYDFEAYEQLEATAHETPYRKFEFWQGDVYGMAGGTARHHFLIENIQLCLLERYKPKGCRIYRETMRLEVKIRNQYLYPDVMVSCEPVDLSAVNIHAPLLIVEVLSASTRTHDLERKRAAYQSLDSLAALWFVDQERMAVTVHTRGADNTWQTEVYTDPQAAIPLPEEVEPVLLRDIYQDIYT